MGEHGHHTILGFDRYAFNFWVLMIFTAIEVVAVALTFSMKGTVSMDVVVSEVAEGHKCRSGARCWSCSCRCRCLLQERACQRQHTVQHPELRRAPGATLLCVCRRASPGALIAAIGPAGCGCHDDATAAVTCPCPLPISCHT